jgi:hypothetical protein
MGSNSSGQLLSLALVGSRQVLVQVSVPQRTVQGAKKLAIPHQEQGGKVEYLVALDQATIIGGVYPAQSVDGQVQAGQMVNISREVPGRLSRR